ncbi:MAG: carbohydrate ABC transporter permease [Chloroflexi bacterium]|nr:carbohydrate ABC transporter permease [Chloroflexota bacterium]
MVGHNTWPRRLFGHHLPLFLYVVFLLFPFYYMLIVSVRPDSDLFNTHLNPLIPQRVTLDHYIYLFQSTGFLRWTLNTVVVTVVATFLSIICSILIGYSLGRLRFPGANVIGLAIFLAYLVPPTLLFLPLAQIINAFHLYNTYWALFLTYPTFLIPFAGWLLMGYFRTIPRELEECAMIDGAGRLRAMAAVVLPLALPGLLSAGIFSFTLSWNEFLYALIFMGTGDMKTIPVGTVSELIKSDVYFWGTLMAAGLLGSVPVAVVYSFFVEHYVSGLTAGAVKG